MGLQFVLPELLWKNNSAVYLACCNATEQLQTEDNGGQFMRYSCVVITLAASIAESIGQRSSDLPSVRLCLLRIFSNQVCVRPRHPAVNITMRDN